MSRNRKRVYIIVGGIVIFFGLLTYLRLKANAKEAAAVQQVIPSVKVETAQRGTIEKTLSFTGDIAAIQQASIFSKVGGNLEQEYTNIGSFVHEGQLLALVDTTIYSQNARQAKASFMQAEATLINAKMNYERNKSLMEQNLIAKQELDNSETAYRVAVAQHEAAGASYRNALTQLGYCKVIAPFTGYITRRFLDPGAYATTSSNVSGSTLFTLMDIGKVKTIVNVLEKQIPLLGKIKEADIKVDAYPNQVFKGRISRISEQLDLSTRTMPIEVDVDNPSNLLKPGMFATVSLILEKKDNALILPAQVVLHDNLGDYVYTLSNDSIVHKTYVKVGIAQDNVDEIVSGISASDKIVFVGQDLVKDGQKVKVSG